MVVPDVISFSISICLHWICLLTRHWLGLHIMGTEQSVHHLTNYGEGNHKRCRQRWFFVLMAWCEIHFLTITYKWNFPSHDQSIANSSIYQRPRQHSGRMRTARLYVYVFQWLPLDINTGRGGDLWWWSWHVSTGAGVGPCLVSGIKEVGGGRSHVWYMGRGYQCPNASWVMTTWGPPWKNDGQTPVPQLHLWVVKM